MLTVNLDIANFYLMIKDSEKKPENRIFNTYSYKSTSYSKIKENSLPGSFFNNLVHSISNSMFSLVLCGFFVILRSYLCKLFSRWSSLYGRFPSLNGHHSSWESHYSSWESHYSSWKNHHSSWKNHHSSWENHHASWENGSATYHFRLKASLGNLINLTNNRFYCLNQRFALAKYFRRCFAIYWNFTNGGPKCLGI